MPRSRNRHRSRGCAARSAVCTARRNRGSGSCRQWMFTSFFIEGRFYRAFQRSASASRASKQRDGASVAERIGDGHAVPDETVLADPRESSRRQSASAAAARMIESQMREPVATARSIAENRTRCEVSISDKRIGASRADRIAAPGCRGASGPFARGRWKSSPSACTGTKIAVSCGIRSSGRDAASRRAASLIPSA